MQKAAITTSIPHITARVYLRSLQKANHTSFTSRFKIHEMLQINQPNFNITILLWFYNKKISVYAKEIMSSKVCPALP